ncbi:RlpA-like double-psi beta-barrel-protein domain-containing protein-containing protein [Lentinula aciculospora]|uniref:RlpA-like double-psi beta-barrel-protein domain-containing protein-containing protein n=1 Tax=Lentinula aciculospora TaxID=153920 RepID=A0A9W9APZ8_9AGAR|nr:RlpA-like double-psi beta-barrel-protein domain-containing protein-containing protein [Lentinula aciculospora]
MSFTKSVVILLSAFSCVQALATPHAIRDVHHHRAVAARVAQPTSGLDNLPPLIVPKKRDLGKRPLRKRCQARPAPTASSSVVSSSSSSSSDTASSSNTASSSVAPVNIGSDPTSISSSILSTSSSDTPTPTPTPTPSPTSTEAPTTTSSSSEAAATTASSDSGSDSDSAVSSFLAGTNSGEATYYATGLGACGITNNDSQFIAAVSEKLFDIYPGYDDVNPNSNPVCNRQISLTYQSTTITVTVTDRCTACAETDLDLSPSAFSALADQSLGRINMSWHWA